MNGSYFSGSISGNQQIPADRFPVGMGYVPMQQWETPYPLETGLAHGTIFSALDYPFVMGRCAKW